MFFLNIFWGYFCLFRFVCCKLGFVRAINKNSNRRRFYREISRVFGMPACVFRTCVLDTVLVRICVSRLINLGSAPCFIIRSRGCIRLYSNVGCFGCSRGFALGDDAKLKVPSIMIQFQMNTYGGAFTIFYVYIDCPQLNHNWLESDAASQHVLRKNTSTNNHQLL